MPSAARLSGTNSVSVIDANASEKPVHSTTSTKISQTWFASHTGPIEWLITVRGRAPRSRAARDEVPEPGAEVGAAEQRVGGDAEHQDDGDDVAHGVGAPRCSAVTASGLAAGRTGRRARPRSPCSRNRRLMARSTSTSVTATPM